VDNNEHIFEYITLLADVIIEHEGAFGMNFGDLEFEARWKCDNEYAYCKKSEGKWTNEEAVSALEGIRGYLKEKLNVKDETARV
jgi:hypothetical protein